MLARERQNAIVDEVNANGSVLVKELAEKYQVTEDSIRKDLTLLQKKGLLKKTYGGAVKVRAKMHDLYVSQRIGKNTPDKQAIAREAMKVIEKGDMVFLDSSTANIELARLLIESGKDVTVVTNMIEIMLMYTSVEHQRFLLIGGMLNDENDAFVGDYTDHQLMSFHFDKTFIGTVGVDLERNAVYTHNVQSAMTKLIVMQNSEKNYIMLETRKLNLSGNYKIASVDAFDGAFMEKEPEDWAHKQMDHYSIEWHYEHQ
ncbi:DeoR/GlpR family DNA-binding transcription regulator [Catenisphaera adipataccumulans]|uniref:DeoR family glycerol-3-phosphate regulon repressor n=1 Tax=Catenisphaera adipataccumulans TaxID=700500 RepID=A0A7W8CYZ8_9FIRM|nr:DeoR/GlpR family DNA-binding transcription regulator [Catenisphaera adipataccumulans]MBB5182555.1 DeoR family glycerol-3-phosphate regulon repressor [Catenisphaera adipataccumulans]